MPTTSCDLDKEGAVLDKAERQRSYSRYHPLSNQQSTMQNPVISGFVA